jgi:DNA topoisomerase-1
MAKNLVVVESPAKAKTLKKYLGKDFEVIASYGHVRDLIPKEGAVDPEHGFAMKYQAVEKNIKHIENFIKALKEADALYLATDPDREGEAISWHLQQLAIERRALGDKPVYRVVFHEITKKAILHAMQEPRDLSIDLIHAQQARRALDFLVGFKLSPLLWKKIRRGLSAGRVQSPALRLIVERQEEIDRFIAQEYWTIEGNCQKDKHTFPVKLIEYQGEKLKQFTLNNEKDTLTAKNTVLTAANGIVTVKSVDKKQRKRYPSPPFITSTLQQEAARKLGFTAQRTMRVAQQLYEGIDVGDGVVGLISYMRTDSVNLAMDAIEEIRAFIAERFSKKELPDEFRVYKTKSKNAQEAHEAIRPTSVNNEPERLKSFLTDEQFKLYRLIWQRTVACQMNHATINAVSIDFGCDNHILRATGSTIADPGFIAVYQEGIDDEKKDEEDGRILPEMQEGEQIQLLSLDGKQHFTEPPPAFTEASLIKALEEYGIGRPSTYASIIHTLQQREYAILDKKRFQPTDVGRIVNKFLTQYFTDYVDYAFTAQLEDRLDEVARGELEWLPVLENFWKPFHALIITTEENVKRSDVTQEKMDENCPKCGKPLSIRLGKHGRFIGCSGYPECDYTRNVGDDTETKPELIEGRTCPECQHPLQVRVGRYGKFVGCTNYPNCHHIEPLEKPEDTNVQCPDCSKGTMLKRKSKRGKIFYSCSTYPTCKYAVWDEPINEPCPKCGFLMLTLKVTKKRGTEKVCPQKNCNFIEKVAEEE